MYVCTQYTVKPHHGNTTASMKFNLETWAQPPGDLNFQRAC